MNALEPSPPPEIWAIPGFRDFMLGMIAVTLANQIQGTVVAYQIYELTRDPLSLGAVGLAEALPFVSLALLGGHVADARDRRRISLLVLVIMFAMSLSLLGFTLERGVLGAVRHKFAIYGVIVVLGVCRSFLQPARAALNAELLPPSLYAKAIAIRTSLFQLAMVSGPAGGGLLYAAVGPHGAYGFSAVLLAVAWSCMFRIPRLRVTAVVKSTTSVAHSIGEGFKYLASDRLLLSALLLDMFGVLFGGATALLPVFANEILAVGSRGFGILRAAPAVGALAASVLLASRPPLRRAGPTLLAATTGFGLSIIGFGLSKSFLLSIGLLALSGALDMVSVVVRSTLLQMRVPGRLLGRVASINQIFIGSSNEIGAFESGVAARLLGVIPSVVFGGGVTLFVTAFTGIRAPELRRLGRLDQVSK
ncbi:MAG TPA: MFS transporter [Polyangiaceae bacterium]|nr:MFS transporter [Polyangiaceae bacterium]